MADTNDSNSIHDLVNCDYYGPEEFKSLLNTLRKRSFSICHTNIRSIHSNVNKLQNLIVNHNHLFDIISLTETWDDVNKRNESLPDLLDGYQPFNGIPGYSQNSGCGFYIKENTNYADRIDLGTYVKNNKHEFVAKWIEHFVIASIYRQPSKNNIEFQSYLKGRYFREKIFSRIKDRESISRKIFSRN